MIAAHLCPLRLCRWQPKGEDVRHVVPERVRLAQLAPHPSAKRRLHREAECPRCATPLDAISEEFPAAQCVGHPSRGNNQQSTTTVKKCRTRVFVSFWAVGVR